LSRAYVPLLGIPPDRAVATLDVRVVSASGAAGGPPRIPRRPAGAMPGPDPRVPTVSQPDPNTLPDLVALPLWHVRTGHTRRRDLLQFAATEWNAGPSPLVVEGFRRPDTNVMHAFQYFFDPQGNPVGRSSAGTLVFDSRRGHQP